MIQLSDVDNFPSTARGGVLSIGNFDGLHRGHTSMLGRAKAIAVQEQRPLVIMTFDPHPMTLLRPNLPRVPLMTTQQRLETLAAQGPDVLLVMPTTREMLHQSAEDFLANTLDGNIGVKHVVEGPTFTFGRAAAGDIAMLVREGPKFGYQTTIVPTVEQTLHDCSIVPVSSSTIRWLVQQGRVSDAARCLGRPYTLRGTVVRGAQRGRTIGFPTANLAVHQLLPAPGVYAGQARVNGGDYAAAISVGDNPTYAGTAVTVEAYLLDFQEDIYDAPMDLEFHRWIREQYKYAGTGPLVRQIERDVAEVRQAANSPGVA